MRTGATRSRHRPALLFVALFSVFALVALAGCDDNSPVAAPTSTAPEPQPSSGSTNESAEVVIPEYETDLDLSDKEKEAVEGALVALDAYVAALNTAFSSGGKNTENIEASSEGEALKVLRADSKELQENQKYMAGEFKVTDRVVHKVSSDTDQVTILTCVDNAAFAEVDLGKSLPSSPPELLRVVFNTHRDGTHWKVGSQGMWSEPCGK